LSSGQAYLFDGVRLVPFGDHIFPQLLRLVDAERLSKCFAAISEEDLEVYWMIPSSTDKLSGLEAVGATVKRSWTQHYAENVGNNPTPFSSRDLDAGDIGFFLSTGNLGRFSDYGASDFPGGFADLAFRFNDRFFTDTFPVLLMGASDGKVYEMNTSTTLGASSSMLSYFQTPIRPVGEGDGKGILRRFEPALDVIAGSDWSLRIDPRGYDRPGGVATGGLLKQMPLDHSGQRYTNHRFAARYMAITMYTTDAGELWTLSGYAATFDAAGER
ncbi:MAG: hypothetical protein ACYSTL_07910, partial [Planctomycetota bacterium]